MSVFHSSARGSTAQTRVPLSHTHTVAEARAWAQRAKLNAQRQSHQTSQPARKKQPPRIIPGRTLPSLRLTEAIEMYLQDHEGGNHSRKTLEWHRTALGLLQRYLEDERDITCIEDVDASAISAWFAHLRTIPGRHRKHRTERTIQTYARSARAFFRWLVRRASIDSTPFELVAFPKVGRPLIQTIEPEEFERLLQACAPPHESGWVAERATARNRAIFWLLYDTGIRVSELCGLRVADFDRKHGLLTVTGKGSKQRRIAVGNTCQRHLLHYLDRHRPNEKELAEWGSPGEDHLFLAEARTPLTKNGVEMLFKRVRERAGITGKRISPHILRHTFAIHYLVLGNDPFSLQELLGHEDMATVKLYMHMNDTTIQAQKRKYSPGDHLPAQMQGPASTRRTGFILKTRGKQAGN
ncbi:MAG: tyrosine-type recombinase/integrase [Ktedonobacteraceae bacterium]